MEVLSEKLQLKLVFHSLIGLVTKKHSLIFRGCFFKSKRSKEFDSEERQALTNRKLQYDGIS